MISRKNMSGENPFNHFGGSRRNAIVPGAEVEQAPRAVSDELSDSLTGTEGRSEYGFEMDIDAINNEDSGLLSPMEQGSKITFVAGPERIASSTSLLRLPSENLERAQSDVGGTLTSNRTSSALLMKTSESYPQIRSRKEVKNDPSVNTHEWKKRGYDATESIVTALYCKIIVILGLALPLSEVISEKVPRGFYQLFYVYLFLGSLLFLTFIYIDLMKTKAKVAMTKKTFKGWSFLPRLRRFLTRTAVTEKEEDEETSNDENVIKDFIESDRLVPRPKQIYGSFYIRMGAVLFGMGALIYSGIEIGVLFEYGLGTSSKPKCNNVIVLTRPFLQMFFVFVQMYFIFLNHKMNIYKRKLVSRFGLMHMIATNLCVWFNVLILETYHEIQELQTENLNSTDSDKLVSLHDHLNHNHHESEAISQCLRSDVMGALLANSAPFLFPCTIEYSLICAAVLYMMWKNTFEEHEHYKSRRIRHKISFRMQIPLKMTPEEMENEIARNLYSMDCSNANNGLFCGIFVMVFTIISLIVFFVLISSEKDGFHSAAITVASMTELILYSVTTVAVVIGIFQVRELWYDSAKKLELDNLLLVVAQTGVLIYSSFCIVGAFFQLQDHLTAFFASVMTLTQTTLQTIFILDASNRFAYCAEQVRAKPGRQVVTFLLVCNLAMWAINTLETNRADSHPIQVNFYGGQWVWPIITHVSMPLAIFYRFHSTVCLCEIWTKSFKYKEYNLAASLS